MGAGEAGEIELQPAEAAPRRTPIDEHGYFVFRNVPVGSHRLVCRTESGRNVVTVPFTV